MRCMEVIEFDSQVAFHNQIEDFLKRDKEEFKITVLARNEVWYGDEDTCDTKYCDEHNIPYSHGKSFGGTGCIVGVKGNVILDIKKVLYGGEALGDRFSKALCEYFKSRGLYSVRCDNNDVLIDDFKVASGAEITLPTGYQYMGFQISIYQDLETIKKVCMKPMLKVPKALDDYGITTDDIVKFCKEYWLGEEEKNEQ